MQHKVVCQGLWLFTWPRASSFICKHRHSQPLFSHMGQLQRGWWAVTAGAPGMFRLRQSWNTHDEWKRILYFFSPTLSSVLDLFISKHSPQIHPLLLSVVSSPLLCFPYPKLFEILGFFLKKKIRWDSYEMVCYFVRCHAILPTVYLSCIRPAHTSFLNTSEQNKMGKSWRKPFKPSSYQALLSTIW